jgi:hypothetical protein
MVEAPESRLRPTKIIVAFGLASRKGDSDPGSWLFNSSRHLVGTGKVREGPPAETGYSGLDLQQQSHQCCCSAAPLLAGLGNLSDT